ncbi:MAG: DUF5688 family protein [Lachnospiraceae bacterium]|nr:DUF5688 family protein [Lachnospiraceae bacterium]
MKDYKDFLEDVKDGLNAYYGEDGRASVTRVEKNNDVQYYGITIRNTDSNISTVIHMEGEFERFRSEGMLENVIRRVVQFHETHAARFSIDTETIRDYGKMKERLICKLVGYERNKKRLQNLPHIRYLDLAVVFCCDMTREGFGAASFEVQKKLFDEWAIDLETLKEDAFHNAPKIRPAKIRRIEEVLGTLMGENVDALCIPEMYVLTTEQQQYGASGLLYPDVLKDFAKEKACNFYILPSSVHEVILLGDIGNYDPKMMAEMVREINISQVEDIEVLSDGVYYYDRMEERVIRL